MTTLAEVYAVDFQLDLDFLSFVAALRPRMRSRNFDRLPSLVTGCVGSDATLSALGKRGSDEASGRKLFADRMLAKSRDRSQDLELVPSQGAVRPNQLLLGLRS